VLAPSTAEEAADEWLWAVPGGYGLMPFTRYCLHIMKIRYETIMYHRMRATATVSKEIDDAALEVLRMTGAGEPVRYRFGTLIAAETRLVALETRLHRVGWTITRLRELRQTVEIALANARTLQACSGGRRPSKGSGRGLHGDRCSVPLNVTGCPVASVEPLKGG
jgi:hypothetical protein